VPAPVSHSSVLIPKKYCRGHKAVSHHGARRLLPG
jgi:hypothetical protein